MNAKLPDTAPPAAKLVQTAPAFRPEPELPGFEHRFSTVDGVRLHYVTGGREDGETVVLLAGFPESWFAWRRMMPLLAGTYRIIAPDLPGQGDSDRPSSGYDTKALAKAVQGVLQQLGVDRYCMAAHDGRVSGTEKSATNPEYVYDLFLCARRWCSQSLARYYSVPPYAIGSK